MGRFGRAPLLARSSLQCSLRRHLPLVCLADDLGVRPAEDPLAESPARIERRRAGRERDQGARGSGKNIDGARGDVKSIGPSTRTPAGQAALIGALDQRIARAQQVVTAANTASQRLAAQLQRVSSGYTQTGGGGGLGSVAGVGQAATSGLGSVAGVPAQFTSQAGTLPSSLGGLTQLANRTSTSSSGR